MGERMYLKPLHLPKARILVLEDDPALHASLSRLLADAGYGLADSMSAADAGGGPVDLVLASAGRIPRSGMAALRLLDRSVPVIALVDRKAWAGFDFFDAANDLGAIAVLHRPFPRTALLRLIAAVLSEPAGDAADCDAEQVGLADLLLQLENPSCA